MARHITLSARHSELGEFAPILAAMTHRLIPATLCVFLTLSPLTFAAAQEAAPDKAPEEDGFFLMEEGAKLFLKGIIEEMEPAIDGLNDLTAEMEPALRQLLDEMGPALADLLDQVEDFTQYHPPEILPNGDIILRRKQPEEAPEEAPEAGTNEAIDL